MLTVQEAAKMVRLTQWAIYRAIGRGDLIAYKPGGRLRIHEQDLQAWLDGTRVSPAGSSLPPPARMVPPPDLVAPSRRDTADGTPSRPRACPATETIGCVSVHQRRSADGGTVWRVRWRQGGRTSAIRSRTFDREEDAAEFDRRVRRLKQTGDPALLADEITLRDYVYGEWWPNYAERRLVLSTQESHSIDLELRIIPRLGGLPLTQLRPNVVEGFAADLEREGTGRATIVSTLAVLQGVMKRAVRDYNLPSNPVKQIDKPSQRREREPLLVSVEQVETMRVFFRGRDDLRSATLLSLLAYAGPRPESEALPLRWGAVRKQSILFRATKRGVAAERATRLLGPLADDLAAWRAASGNPPDDAPVIPNRRGDPWSDYDWDNWRERGFRSAARAAGLPAGDEDGPKRVRPRDLRSSFATLLIYEGQPPQYVAEQLGHSAATLLRDYVTAARTSLTSHRVGLPPAHRFRW